VPRKAIALTQEQIDSIVEKYAASANVLDFFYTTPANTFIDLAEALQYGLKANYFSGMSRKKLPEFNDSALFPATVKSDTLKLNIVKRILQRLIDDNPQYFRRVSKNKYAINESFIVDFLFYNRDKKYDKIDIKSIYYYILDFDNFSRVIETFFLPDNKEETVFTARRHFRETKPYKYSKKANVAASTKKP